MSGDFGIVAVANVLITINTTCVEAFFVFELINPSVGGGL